MSAQPPAGGSAVRLVAWREIVTRVRTRSFRIALGITVASVVLGVLAPKLLHDTPEPYDVDIVGTIPQPSVQAIRDAGTAVGRKVLIHEVDDVDAARGHVESGDADLAFDGSELVVRRVPSATDTGTFARFLATVNTSLRVYEGLYDTGLSPDDAQAALAHPPLPVTGLLPPRDDRVAQKATVSVGIVLIFIFLQQYGTWILNGIIEEKSSRVVEVLLAVVGPRELLIGKTAGIGGVALLHGCVVAGAALLTAVVTGSSVLEGGGTGIVLALLMWFLLAYALYCLLMAMAGALVSRPEEAQNAAFPFLAPMLIGYIASISTVFADTPPPFVKVLSFIPLSAPFAMPARMAAGPVPAGQVLLSVTLSVVAVLVAARLAIAVYSRAVLQTSRVRWGELLRLERV